MFTCEMTVCGKKQQSIDPGGGTSQSLISELDVTRHGALVRPARGELVLNGRSPGRTAEQIAQQVEKAGDDARPALIGHSTLT